MIETRPAGSQKKLHKEIDKNDKHNPILKKILKGKVKVHVKEADDQDDASPTKHYNRTGEGMIKETAMKFTKSRKKNKNF